jgi:hypothetical protein
MTGGIAAGCAAGLLVTAGAAEGELGRAVGNGGKSSGALARVVGSGGKSSAGLSCRALDNGGKSSLGGNAGEVSGGSDAGFAVLEVWLEDVIGGSFGNLESRADNGDGELRPAGGLGGARGVSFTSFLRKLKSATHTPLLRTSTRTRAI